MQQHIPVFQVTKVRLEVEGEFAFLCSRCACWGDVIAVLTPVMLQRISCIVMLCWAIIKKTKSSQAASRNRVVFLQRAAAAVWVTLLAGSCWSEERTCHVEGWMHLSRHHHPSLPPNSEKTTVRKQLHADIRASSCPLLSLILCKNRSMLLLLLSRGHHASNYCIDISRC